MRFTHIACKLSAVKLFHRISFAWRFSVSSNSVTSNSTFGSLVSGDLDIRILKLKSIFHRKTIIWKSLTQGCTYLWSSIKLSYSDSGSIWSIEVWISLWTFTISSVNRLVISLYSSRIHLLQLKQDKIKTCIYLCVWVYMIVVPKSTYLFHKLFISGHVLLFTWRTIK